MESNKAPVNVRNGKVALITGSSSGIGQSTAIRFAEQGYSLSLCARDVPIDVEGLAETKAQCLAINSALTPNDIFTMTCDLAKEKDCEEVVSNTMAHFKKLNVLVANAGILAANPLETMPMEEYDRMMNINCRAVVVMMKLCIPHLIETKGNVVNVSSLSGVRAIPGIMAYCMSKAAVTQLTRCAALELAPKGVRVNAVNPGMIKTKLHSNSGMSPEAYTDFVEAAKRTHPLGRAGTPEEVANAIAFLASDEASFITGTNLSVDSGRAVMCPR